MGTRKSIRSSAHAIASSASSDAHCPVQKRVFRMEISWILASVRCSGHSKASYILQLNLFFWKHFKNIMHSFIYGESILGDQKTACGSWFSPPIPGIELRSLGLAASVFILQASLPACIYLFLFTFEFCSVESQSKVLKHADKCCRPEIHLSR